MALWLSGYDKALSGAVELSPVDQGHMALVGNGVGLSCMMALASGALASTWVTVGHATAIQITIAIVTGVALAAFVLRLDQGIIVATDHRPTGQPKWWVWLIRIGIILAVSTSTLLKIAPSFIGPALAAQAVDVREHRDNQRRANLVKQFDVKGITDNQVAAVNRVDALSREIETVPADIDRALTDASSCFGRVASMRQRLVDSGISTSSASKRVAPERIVCASMRRRAEDRLANHRAELRVELENQRNDAAALRGQRDAAIASVDERVADGRNNDRESITQTNLSILSKLFSNDPMARTELLALWLLLVICDGAGLIIKAAIGRTEAGERIGGERGIAKLEADTRFEVAEQDRRECIAMRKAFGDSMIAALSSAAGRDAFDQSFAKLAGVIAPLAAAELAAKEAEEHARSIERVMRRSPRLAVLLARLLADALDIASRSFANARP